MSRLTASPFVKPSPLDFVRRPLTPPETAIASTSDHVAPSQSVSVAAGLQEQPLRPLEGDSISAHVPHDPGARFRRVSSLAYHSSGLSSRERERPIQKSFKSFIIVTPPPSFLHEFGQLGHTLSSGPSHRLGQGLLMPLFPTMYGQLTAIAREFNFPSTTGLCIYLHYVDNGINCTPRISDDTWGHLWGSMLEGTSSGNSKLPICGKVEFDIDFQLARWYGAWVASSQRVAMDHPIGRSHHREESKATFTDDYRTADDQSERLQPLQRPPTLRHVPKKLSLVDRFDVASSITSRPAAPSPPENTSSRGLSPIFQTEEPPSSKNELEFRVRSWRASAKMDPTPLAAMGQTSLEPANMPNSLELNDKFSAVGEEPLRLEDFTWSISSKGPGSDILDSPTSCSRLPSVHIAARAAGSVCLTPSVATSFGPSDYTLSPLSVSSFRVHTPDIAHRMYEDCPMTPTTATSWGPASVYSDGLWMNESDRGYSVDIGHRMVFSPPDSPCTATSWGPGSWPPSPVHVSRAPSVDLGERAVYSRPVTPSTATSWGPGSWPSSPAHMSRAPSVDLGERGVYSRPVTPSTATSWGAPLSYPPSPITPFHVTTPDAGQRSFDFEDPVDAPWPHVWPYSSRARTDRARVYERQGGSTGPWAHVWPYGSRARTGSNVEHRRSLSEGPSRHVWPYPLKARSDTESVHKRASSGGPSAHNSSKSRNSAGISNAGPWPFVWPYTRRVEPSRDYQTSAISYPSLIIYPAVYPNFDLYPATLSPQNIATSYALARAPIQTVSVKCPTFYPNFDLYPAVYPFNLHAHIRIRYPTFELYPSVYPFVTPYTPVSAVQVQERSAVQNNRPGNLNTAIVVQIGTHYPTLEIYSNVYPYVTPYPSVVAMRNDSKKVLDPVLGTQGARYPAFNLYPAVYPSLSIAEARKIPNVESVSVHHKALYPVLVLYHAVYPHFDLYPSLPRDVLAKFEAVQYQPSSRCVYPVFDLYPAVYPFFDLYPAVLTLSGEQQRPTIPVLNKQIYPLFVLYPAVYPHFDLYPSLGPSIETIEKKIVGQVAKTVYPFLTIYPSVYPHFDLYPSPMPVIEAPKSVDILAKTSYPFLTIYPAVYPHFDLWPVPAASVMQRRRRSHKELHAAAMKGFVYAKPAPPPKLRVPPSKTHQDLHNEVWQSVARPPSLMMASPSRAGPPSSHRPPARPRSRAGSIIGLPPTPPPSRRLPPVAEPPARNLPMIPPHSGSAPSSPETAMPVRRLSTMAGAPPMVSLPARPNVNRTQSLSSRTSTYGRRELPRLPSVDEGTVRSNSATAPAVAARMHAENDLSRAPSSATPRVVRKRDSLVLQRVKAINSNMTGDEKHLDTLDTYSPVRAMPTMDHGRYPSR